jgi:orotate phosphoribosyltransferase
MTEMSVPVDEVADALFRSGCIKFGSFRIKSGAISPYYVDLASLLSSPKEMCKVVDLAATKTDALIHSDGVNKLASIELKGALLLPSIACKVNLPCVVVRKEEKAYGVTGRFAGAEVNKGDTILFFDDVISEGLSKLEGMKPLTELGATVNNLLVVVDREQGGKEKLESTGIKVCALAKISELVVSLCKSKNISEKQIKAVLRYVQS